MRAEIVGLAFLAALSAPALSTLALSTLALSTPARADEPACRDLMHDGRAYTVCTAEAPADIRLFQTGPDGQPFGTFAAVDAALAASGARLAFAMNGGMYHPDRRPVGLLVENGTERATIVTREGPGNFGMLPNGVFCVVGGRFAVIESRAYAADPPGCLHASQSGPMLVIGGALHPRFLPDSDSRYVRNGVGVSADGGRVAFAISNERVTFHEFARLFRDGLGMPDALYFDGNISRLHAPGLRREDAGFPMGPIVGLVVPDG